MNKNLIMKNKLFVLPVLMVLVTVFVSCGAKQPENGMEADNYSNKEILAMRKVYTDEEIAQNGWQKATFGGGCFWCTEAIFEEVKGVKSVLSGYSGGPMKNPTYQAVCTDTTGHAE